VTQSLKLTSLCATALFSVLSISSAQEVPSASQTHVDSFRIERHRAGPVSIGANAYELYETFPLEGRKLIDLALEATLSPALALTVPGATVPEGVIAELAPQENELVVFRILISDPMFRTSKGIGVGSSVGDLRSAYNLDAVSTAEGGVYITVEELAASFALDQSGPGGSDLWRIQDPQGIPGDVKIAVVLLTQ